MNTNNSFKLNHFFSVIIGALIGTIVGKSLISVWGTWTVFIGPLVGALCFLFIVAPKTTVSIIKFSAISAWRIFVVELSYKRMLRDIFIWSRSQFIKISTSIIAGCLVGVATVATFLSVAILAFWAKNEFQLTTLIQKDGIDFILGLVTGICAFCAIYCYLGKDPFIEWIKLAFFYINPIAMLFWVCLFVFVLLRVSFSIFIPWVFSEFLPAAFRFVLRFSTSMQSGLQKHGLILGATSASTGALIGQFHEQLWLGGLIGGSVYCVVHGTVWTVAAFAKAFPSRFLYGR